MCPCPATVSLPYPCIPSLLLYQCSTPVYLFNFCVLPYTFPNTVPLLYCCIPALLLFSCPTDVSCPTAVLPPSPATLPFTCIPALLLYPCTTLVSLPYSCPPPPALFPKLIVSPYFLPAEEAAPAPPISPVFARDFNNPRVPGSQGLSATSAQCQKVDHSRRIRVTLFFFCTFLQ